MTDFPSPTMAPVQRHRLALIQAELTKFASGGSPGTISSQLKIVGMVCGHMDDRIGRLLRLQLFSWAFGRPIQSSKDLTVPEMFGLLMWASASRPAGGGRWAYPLQFEKDLELIMIAGGQVSFLDPVGDFVPAPPPPVWRWRASSLPAGQSA